MIEDAQARREVCSCRAAGHYPVSAVPSLTVTLPAKLEPDSFRDATCDNGCKLVKSV